MPELSILIPARNEEFLARTIEDILANITGNTEVIAVLDGTWAAPPIPDHPRVSLIYHSKSIGQRAATNEAARLSKARFIMKVDAHCAFDKGFDTKLMADCQPDWTVIPRLYNLHVFDWLCKGCGNRTYQGPKPEKCEKCKGTEFERVMVWQPRKSRRTDFARFDHELHFQYWGEYEASREKKTDSEDNIANVMCCVGAAWFMHRERYWQLGGLDEQHGSWGQVGVELACKSWLSGGRQVVNKKTWYAHCFRTQPGWGFPYPNPGVGKAREYSRKLWLENTWPGQIHPLSWLLEKFAPVSGWHVADSDEKKLGVEEQRVHAQARENALVHVKQAGRAYEANRGARSVDHKAPVVSSGAVADRAPTKAILYYTENQCPEPLASIVRARLRACANGNQIVSVSLKPIDNLGTNVVLAGRSRGILTMFKQILAGLEASQADIMFLCEHDMLYSPSHFDFVPPRQDAFFYNLNVWKVDAVTGQALHYRTKQTSGLCAYRELLLGHYRRRIAKCEQNARDLQAQGLPVKNDGYSRYMGFEPGCHREPRGVDNYPALDWWSEQPNIDVRHGRNLTPSRWSQDEFRDKNSCLGWTLAEGVPGWGQTKGRFAEFLQGI